MLAFLSLVVCIYGGMLVIAQGDKAGPGAYYYRGVMPSKFTAEMGRHIVEACKGPYPKGIEVVRSVV